MMARKNLGKLALLGGAALLASRMMKGKGDKEGKKDTDTTADASAGMAKDRLGGTGLDRGDMDTSGDASAGMARDRLADLEKRARSSSGAKAAPPTTARSKVEGATASGLPREARNVEPTFEGALASGLPREARGVRTAGAGGRDPSRYGKPVKLDELGFKKGGKVPSASKRADGIAQRGKTKGRMI